MRQQGSPDARGLHGPPPGRDVAYWHKADMREPPINIRFWGNSGHRLPHSGGAASHQAIRAQVIKYSGAKL
jgi:hypothetical protein